MTTSPISAPLPEASVVTGADYNRLRQDALNNHSHNEPGSGGQISHLDLLDIGVYTHPQIDAKLDALEAAQSGETGSDAVYELIKKSIWWRRLQVGAETWQQLEARRLSGGYHIVTEPDCINEWYVVQLTVEVQDWPGVAQMAIIPVVKGLKSPNGFDIELLDHTGNVYNTGWGPDKIVIHYTVMYPQTCLPQSDWWPGDEA